MSRSRGGSYATTRSTYSMLRPRKRALRLTSAPAPNPPLSASRVSSALRMPWVLSHSPERAWECPQVSWRQSMAYAATCSGGSGIMRRTVTSIAMGPGSQRVRERARHRSER
ncbi:hypothetical protein [Streptomyces sp. NBC_01622]|uniref:hypothetical protein n=1 Tax=Streptomyces sp. NBC_01622 TaxID=2975903 RepID=UPI003864AFE3